MKSFHLSPAGEQKLEEIVAHTAAERPSAVQGVLDAIEAACQLVAEYPGVGRSRDEIDEGVMSLPIGWCILSYYLGEDPIGIARVLHRSRDLTVAFRDA